MLTKHTAFALIAVSYVTATNVGAAEHKWKMAASWGGGPLMEIGAKAIALKHVQVHPTGLVNPDDPDNKTKFFNTERF